MQGATKIRTSLLVLAALSAGCVSSSSATEVTPQDDTPMTVSIPSVPTTAAAVSVTVPPTVPVEQESDVDDIDGVGYAVDGPSGRVAVIWNDETGAVSVDVPAEFEGSTWAISALSAEGIIGEPEILDSSTSTVLSSDAELAGVVLSSDSLDVVVPFTTMAAAAYSSTWEPASVMPRSGIWTLEMLIGGEYLNGPRCPSGGATFASSGEAQIATTSGGWSFTLIADGEYISALRQDLYTATYISGERPFPVQTATGSGVGVAVYEFEAVSPDRLEGSLTWDNHDGCIGTYPITLDLDSPYDFIYDIPEPGIWQLQIDLQSTCGTVAPMITVVDLEVSGGVGGLPALATDGWLSLLVGNNGNLSSLGPLFLPGVMAQVMPLMPPMTPIPAPVFGTIQMVPVTAGSYLGTFIGSPVGTPGCTIIGTIQFVRVG